MPDLEDCNDFNDLIDFLDFTDIPYSYNSSWSNFYNLDIIPDSYISLSSFYKLYSSSPLTLCDLIFYYTFFKFEDSYAINPVFILYYAADSSPNFNLSFDTSKYCPD